MFKYLINFAGGLLNSPRRILLYCTIFIFFALVFDGSFFRLWELHREKDRLIESIAKNQEATTQLDVKIGQAHGLQFVEHQAKDRFDLVQEDEIVFLFSED